MAEFAEMAHFLRDRFPVGIQTPEHLRMTPLELLDQAERGDAFSCGTISRMLVQAVQAGGQHGREIAIDAHSIAELYSGRWQKWVAVDANFDVYFTSLDGEPLSAYEIHRAVREGREAELVAHPGGSASSPRLGRERSTLELYRRGVGIRFYDRWISQRLPRWHPARSPVESTVWLGDQDLASWLYYTHVGGDPAAFYSAPAPGLPDVAAGPP